MSKPKQTSVETLVTLMVGFFFALVGFYAIFITNSYIIGIGLVLVGSGIIFVSYQLALKAQKNQLSRTDELPSNAQTSLPDAPLQLDPELDDLIWDLGNEKPAVRQAAKAELEKKLTQLGAAAVGPLKAALWWDKSHVADSSRHSFEQDIQELLLKIDAPEALAAVEEWRRRT